MAKFSWKNLAQAGAELLLGDDDPPKKPRPKDAEPPEPAGIDIEIFVAPRGSDAHAAAEERADDERTFAERKLFRALNRAAEHLDSSGPCTVTVRVAEGQQTGKANTGTWLVPEIDAPGSKLHLLGGYDASWGERRPFERRAVLECSSDRTAPVLQFSRESRLQELYLSGLVMDTGNANRYDNEGNLLTGQTNAYEILALSYLEFERLVIADNTFINGGHRVAETLVRAASDDAEIVVRNNLILNNVMAWRAFTAHAPHKPRRYRIEHNSFILNWPRNPDRGTSNPGTLEIGDKHTAEHIEVRRNLFAWNAGGALHVGAEDTPLRLEENLFWGNGALFEVENPGDAAVVGKFNRAREYVTFDPIDLEDNFDWPVADNLVADPRLRVQIKEFKGFSSVADTRAEINSAETNSAETKPADAKADDAEVTEGSTDTGTDDALPGLEDLAGLGQLDEFEEPEEDPAAALALDDDLFLDLEPAEDGGLDYRNFATRLYLDAPESPFPRSSEAQGYGADPARVEEP